MLSDVKNLVGDDRLAWGQRLTRLQGWRGSDAEQADALPLVQRVGPAICAAGAVAGVAAASAPVLAVFAATALVGAFAANHPFEWLYNAWASGRGRPRLPRNRAAKRLGCAMGAVFLGGAAAAYAVGADTLGSVLALVLGATATFVAVTGMCIPSLVFTALWGPRRACAPSWVAAVRTPRESVEPSVPVESSRSGALP